MPASSSSAAACPAARSPIIWRSSAGRDIVLLERKQLTCGTTWHAAGLIGQLRAIAEHDAARQIFRRPLCAARSRDRRRHRHAPDRLDHRCADRASARRRSTAQASLARAFGVEVDEIVARRGQGALSASQRRRRRRPPCICRATASATRPTSPWRWPRARGRRGAKIIEGVKVTAVHQADGRVTGVDWRAATASAAAIAADIVVNCAGMWARDLAAHGRRHRCRCMPASISTSSPSRSPALAQLPVLRVPDECAYYKEDAGKMLLGAFEPMAKPWGMDGIPEDFCFDQLPEDFDHFEPILEKAVNRMPMLADGRHPHLLQRPGELHARRPLLSRRGAGAERLLGRRRLQFDRHRLVGRRRHGAGAVDGRRRAALRPLGGRHPPRAAVPDATARYLKERVTETLGLLYADHFPYRQLATARGVRRSPLHEHLKARGAVFGETAGWERANWFARAGPGAANTAILEAAELVRQPARRAPGGARRRRPVRHDLLRQDPRRGPRRLRLPAAALRQRHRRRAGPHRLHPDAERARRHRVRPDRHAAVARPPSCWSCPARRCSATSPGCAAISATTFVVITDVTAAEAVLCRHGAEVARRCCRRVSPNDFSNEAHPFGTAREIEIGMGLARAHRVTYVGELGWELYVSRRPGGPCLRDAARRPAPIRA